MVSSAMLFPASAKLVSRRGGRSAAVPQCRVPPSAMATGKLQPCSFLVIR
jgi:hypothetical protein